MHKPNGASPDYATTKQRQPQQRQPKQRDAQTPPTETARLPNTANNNCAPAKRRELPKSAKGAKGGCHEAPRLHRVPRGRFAVRAVRALWQLALFGSRAPIGGALWVGEVQAGALRVLRSSGFALLGLALLGLALLNGTLLESPRVLLGKCRRIRSVFLGCAAPARGTLGGG